MLGNAAKITNEYAYDEHISEFSHLGIKTLDDFSRHVDIVIKSPTESFVGKNGKEYFWHEPTKTFAVIDKAHPDMGTAFIPTRGKAYYSDTVLKFKN